MERGQWSQIHIHIETHRNYTTQKLRTRMHFFVHHLLFTSTNICMIVFVSIQPHCTKILAFTYQTYPNRDSVQEIAVFVSTRSSTNILGDAKVSSAVISLISISQHKLGGWCHLLAKNIIKIPYQYLLFAIKNLLGSNICCCC